MRIAHVLTAMTILALAGCTGSAGTPPVVNLASAQAEAGAILAAIEAGATIYTTASTTTPAEAAAVENVLAIAKAGVTAFQSAQATETPVALAETAAQDIMAVLAVLPIDPATKTAIDAGMAVIDGLVAGLAGTPGSLAAGPVAAPHTPSAFGARLEAKAPVPIPVPQVLPPAPARNPKV